ncbi:MAG: hypothetical protein ACYC4L_00215 [Chloroflexota bacterium]
MQGVVEDVADRIVEALMRRAAADAGLTVEQVQRLLVLRVQADAESHGLATTELMAAVWQSWERHDRPPMLGQGESYRIVGGLVRKGILALDEGQDGVPAVRWGSLSRAEVEQRFDELSHDERLFLLGVLRYLKRIGAAPR